MPNIRLTGFGFAFFCLFLSNSMASGQPAQNQPTQSRKGYCKAWSSDQATIYFSDVFEINVPYNAGTRGIENLFEAYLKQSYGYNSTPVTPVVCEYLQSAAASEESKKQGQALYTMKGKQLVETRWKLSPQQAAAVSLIPAPPQCYDSNDAKTPGCEQILHPAAANSNAILYELCRAVTSVQTAGKRTTYFSAIMPRANINEADYAAAFAVFLAKKYGVQGINPDPSMCAAVPSPAEGQELMDVGWWKVNPNFSTSVQTGWTYSPPSPPASSAPAVTAVPVPPVKIVPAAPVPSAAATTAPKVTQAVCWADFDPHTMYYSAVFDGTRGDYNVWMPAFKQFLEQKYHYTGLVRCTKRPNPADAQKYWNDMVGTARSLTLGDGSKPKIIETAWKYK
jgi:hypothetical protein